MPLSTHPCQGRGEEAGAYPRVHPGRVTFTPAGSFELPISLTQLTAR